MSTITSYAQLVPWGNKEEWLEVYNKLYSNEIVDLEWAVNRVSLWQARCPTSAFLGVETTAALVRTRLEDQVNASKGIPNGNQVELSMMYSMAIVRFVNLVCEIGKNPNHVIPIRNIAQRMGIPEWLVNIRHSATHKYSIPSLDMLRTGSSVALQWLKLNYWEKEMSNLQNHVATRGSGSRHDKGEIIRDWLREFQELQFDVLYGDKQKKVQKSKRAALQDTLNKLGLLLRTHPNLFAKILSESGFLVSKYHHLEAILKPGEKEFLENNSVLLPHSLEHFWAPVLNLFLLSDPLQCLIRCLIQPHNPEDLLADRVAVAWLSHLLNIITEKQYRIFFFRPTIDWLELFEVALKQPTEFSPHILKIISEHVPINEDVKQNLMALVAILLGNVRSTINSKNIKTIYTAKDILKKTLPEHLSLEPSGSWKKYIGSTQWQSLPIGSVIQELEAYPEEIVVKIRNNEVKQVPEVSTMAVGVEEMSAEPYESIDEETFSTTVTQEPDLSNSLLFF